MRTITITGNKPAELNIQGDNDPRIAYIKKSLNPKNINITGRRVRMGHCGRTNGG